MLAQTRDWLDGLRDFAAEHRLRKPLVEPAEAAERAAERMILAAELATTLGGWEAVLSARRLPAGGDADPAIVITTSAVGIATVAEQLASGSPLLRALIDRCLAVTELEYRLWCIRRPDEGHKVHVNLWNWIKKRVPSQRQAEFARHPLGPGEDYWLHRAGLAGAGPADRRDCHLWKWNGRHAALLEANVIERGVAEL